MKTAAYFALATLAGTLLFSSCKKDEADSDIADTDLQEVSANNETENEADDLQQNADDAVQFFDARLNGSGTTGPNSYSPAGLCWTAVLDPAAHTITVSFDSTCQGRNGRYRRGSLLVSYTPNYRATPGATVITVPQQYFVSRTPFSATNPGNRVKGVRTVMNIGLDADSVMVREGEISFTDGTTATWTADKRREWTTGATTEDRSDDVFAITRMHKQGSTRNGRTFTADALTPVIWKRACWLNNGFHNPVQGSVVVKVQGRRDRVIDYGAGTCDNVATVTIGNRTRTIQLP